MPHLPDGGKPRLVHKLRYRQADWATVGFADEARIRSDYYAGTTWAPVGVTPRDTVAGWCLLTLGALRRLQKLPRLVEFFFQQPECHYASQ